MISNKSHSKELKFSENKKVIYGKVISESVINKVTNYQLEKQQEIFNVQRKKDGSIYVNKNLNSMNGRMETNE